MNIIQAMSSVHIRSSEIAQNRVLLGLDNSLLYICNKNLCYRHFNLKQYPLIYPLKKSLLCNILLSFIFP